MPFTDIITRLCLLGAITISLTGCGLTKRPQSKSGYTQTGNQWTYVVVNAAVGREVRTMSVDPTTFRILGDRNYACDKDHVFKYGVVLQGVDGGSFEFLEGNDYARDAANIYFRDCVVPDADRESFRVLDVPYARDAKNIYCGCVRMNVADPDAFRVLGQEGPIPGMQTTDYLYSSDDLVERFGDEFADHRVMYDRETQIDRFRLATTDSGTATDGIWFFNGPKRSHHVQ